MQYRKLVALLCISISAVRCASIIHGTTQKIPVTSEPTAANVSLKCLEGTVEAASLTPTTVVLKRNKVSCAIVVSKEGYQPSAVQLQRKLSGWYIANLLIGGIVGFIVDAADGAMFNQSPRFIRAILSESAPAAVEQKPAVQMPAPAVQPAPVAEAEPSQPRVEPSQPSEKRELRTEVATPPPAPTPVAPPAEATPVAAVTSPPALTPKKETSVAEAKPPAQVQPPEKKSRTAPGQKVQQKYRIQVVNGVRDAWKVLVTNDPQAVLGCASLKKTSKEYNFAGSFPVREVQEDAARVGGNVVLFPTTSGRQAAVIFSCTASD
jgi:hypothetical protein